MVSVPLSNKMWRKTHLFDSGRLDNVYQKTHKLSNPLYWVDKNNHKIQLVMINNKAYRRK